MADAQQQHKPVTGYPAAQPSYPTGPTATAYPYPAPPPAPYYPNPYPQQQPYSQYYNPRRATFLRRFVVAIIAAFIIFGSISFILWLVYRPHLPEFSVTSASVSPLNVSAAQLTANFDFALSVHNPNKKMTIDYDSLAATVFYRHDNLAEGTLSPFFQGKGNDTTIRARLASAANYINDSTARDLTSSRAGGTLRFELRLFAWVRFDANAWRTRRHFMRVWCGNIDVAFSSSGSGSLSGGAPKECEVDL